MAGSDRPSPAYKSVQILRAARFLNPESADAVEALMEDLGLEYMGAEKVPESVIPSEASVSPV